MLVLATWIARDLASLVTHLTAAPPRPRGWLILVQAWTLPLLLRAAWLESAAWRRHVARGPTWAPLGRLLVLGTAAWLLLVLGQGEGFRPWRVDLAKTLLAAAWSSTLLAEPWIARVPSSFRRRAGRLLVAASATLFLTECSLRLLAELQPRPILTRRWDGARETIARNRLPAGSLHFSLPLNSGGHNDDEFEPKQRGWLRVVSLGDSFSLYTVPKTHHFTRLAEERLSGVEVCNLGVASIGPAEYALLLSEEGLPLEPDLVLVNLFVGNDIEDACRSAAESRTTPLRDLFDARRTLVSLVPRRLWALHGERRAGTLFAAEREEASDAPALRSAADVEARLPFLADPSLELPAFTRENFLAVETYRAGYLRNASADAYEPLFEYVRSMQRELNGIPLAAMLIPDAFQVEDELWSACRAAKPDAGESDRDRPQRILREFCAAEGIPVLDLLPALRAVPPLQDGERHLYHRNDTHFNARGNRVAGEQLAEFLRQLLQGQERESATAAAAR